MEKKRLKKYYDILLLLLILYMCYYQNGENMVDYTEPVDPLSVLLVITVFHCVKKYIVFPKFISKRLQPVCDWVEKYYRFLHIRQIRGSKPIKLDNTECVCLNCGNTFTGNYCNRCAQTRYVDRVTWKTMMKMAFLAFTRLATGYKRTVVELVYRPGYMISDYLHGHRIPYMAPFQALLFTVAIYAVTVEVVTPDVVKNVDIKKTETIKTDIDDGDVDIIGWLKAKVVTTKDMSNFVDSKVDVVLGYNKIIWNIYVIIDNWVDNSKLYILVTTPMFTIATFLATAKRRKKNLYNPTEHLFIQCYIVMQILIFTTIKVILTGNVSDNVTYVDLPMWLYFLIYCYDYKQLFGYGIFKASWIVLLMFIYFILIFILWIFVIIGIKYGMYELLN